MRPLFVLLGVFIACLLITKLIRGNYEIALSGRIALSAMLVFTAIGHFIFTKGMSLMMPDGIPYREEVIYFTGILELVIAVDLLLENYSVVSAWVLIVFLLLVLPANIYACVKELDYQNATFDGNGLAYLWFRIPLQLFFIAWTYFAVLHR
ncbi:membrane protein [Galbibacter marinus]|uniref:Membrane protein n=1 Tax=Galbibacter marinus TaxID=555500 RepID=K2PU98_9FLAO|nr:membrane protein [Galbibacter marinus]EKF55149.1 membrane protein [Galbibacter marinus]